MREIRLSGSEGGGTGNSTGPPYPYPGLGAGDEAERNGRAQGEQDAAEGTRQADGKMPGQAAVGKHPADEHEHPPGLGQGHGIERQGRDLPAGQQYERGEDDGGPASLHAPARG